MLTTRVAQLEEQFGLTRVLVYQLRQVVHQLVVHMVGHQRDGDAVDGALLNGLQELYTAYFQVFRAIFVVHKSALNLTRYIHRSTD